VHTTCNAIIFLIHFHRLTQKKGKGNKRNLGECETDAIKGPTAVSGIVPQQQKLLFFFFFFFFE
jgi:hypothetical protein